MATYCTRIYVKVNEKALMQELCSIDISDLGMGFYQAEDIFSATSAESNFFDGESAINECDLKTIVERVVKIIEGNGTILADTYSYDYDPFPQVCYYNGGNIISKLLKIDGEEFCDTVEITDEAAWIRFVEETDELDENFFED